MENENVVIADDDDTNITQTMRDAIAKRVCPSCGMTGDASCWYGDGICGKHNAGWNIHDNTTT